MNFLFKERPTQLDEDKAESKENFEEEIKKPDDGGKLGD